MPVHVVDLLEEVDVEHDGRELRAGPARVLEESLGEREEVAPVEDTREAVGDGELADLGEEPGVVVGDHALTGHGRGELDLCGAVRIVSRGREHEHADEGLPGPQWDGEPRLCRRRVRSGQRRTGRADAHDGRGVLHQRVEQILDRGR